MQNELIVGVSLAVHNTIKQTRKCLTALYASRHTQLLVVVIDDGSNDGTAAMIQKEFPKTTVLQGNGDLWWARATNMGIQYCLDAGCDYIMLLNPDVIVTPETCYLLTKHAINNHDAIVSPVVLDFDSPSLIWEAGHSWEPVFHRFPLFWVSKYLFKHGTSVKKIPTEPYKTVSVVGRGGIISRTAIETLGPLDADKFPQYGADADLSIRAFNAQYPMYIVPTAKVLLHSDNTGRPPVTTFRAALVQYWNYLFSIKQGNALHVLYHLNLKNLPLYKAIPNYLFMLSLNTFRFWQSYLKRYFQTR